MSGAELFEQGRLKAAVDAQTEHVKAHPGDQGARFLLYQFLLFTGDIDRAEKHLGLLEGGGPESAAAVALYRAAGEAERARRRVLAGDGRPNFLADAPPHVEARLEAVKHFAAGDAAAGRDALARAEADAPAVGGTIDGRPVTGLRDADDLFGDVLEVFGSNGLYCWLPMSQVEQMNIAPPKSPKDLVYLPAHVVIKGGDSGDVLLPAVYPGTAEAAGDDDELRLGRAADWVGDEAGPTRGVGGRLLAHAGGHAALVNLRELTAD